jgi:hypothetical protein
MAPKRHNSYYNARTVALLGDVFTSGSVSNRINNVIDRYFELIGHAGRDLAKIFDVDELEAIRAHVPAIWSRSERATALLADLPDYVAAKLGNEMSSTEDQNAKAEIIKKKIDSLQPIHLLAIIEMCEKNTKEKGADK